MNNKEIKLRQKLLGEYIIKNTSNPKDHWYDAYDESFNHPLINEENGFIWYENGSFKYTLVVDLKTGVAMRFKNLGKALKFDWKFESIHEELTNLLSGVRDNG